MVGIEEFWRHEVDMAIPEARGDGEAGAVDGLCVGGKFGGVCQADGHDARIMHEDRGVVKRGVVRLGINRRVGESDVGGVEGMGKDKKSDRSEDQETHEWLYASGEEIDPGHEPGAREVRLVSGRKTYPECRFWPTFRIAGLSETTRSCDALSLPRVNWCKIANAFRQREVGLQEVTDRTDYRQNRSLVTASSHATTQAPPRYTLPPLPRLAWRIQQAERRTWTPDNKITTETSAYRYESAHSPNFTGSRSNSTPNFTQTPS